MHGRQRIWEDALLNLKETYKELEKMDPPAGMKGSMQKDYQKMMESIDIFLVDWYG